MKVQNPHDKFFKKTFGDAATARDFLNNFLPQNIMDIIDIKTLEPQKDSFVNKELHESFSDLLYKANINNQEGYLYFLFEHKSYPSRDVAFQLLKYIVRIWDAKIGETGQLPIIIPLIIYHGKDSWNIKPTLGGMVLGYNELPQDIQTLIPDYQYLLFDLSRFAEEEIKGAVTTRIAVTILRDIQRKGISAILEIILNAASLLQEFEDKETGLEYFETLMRYIFSIRADLTRKDFMELVKKIETTYPEGSERVMTLEQVFKEEGRKEGIMKGKLEVARNAIKEGMEPGLVERLTGLSKKEIETIAKEVDE